MKNRPRFALAVLIAVTTLACQPAGRSSAGLGSEVRDSAGIRIIENSRPPDRSRLPWRIGPKSKVEARIVGHVDDGESDGIACLIPPHYQIIVWQRTREGVWESGSHGISFRDVQGDYGRQFKLSSYEADLRPSDATSDGSILEASAAFHDFRRSLGHMPVWDSWGDLVVLGNTSRYELRAFRVDDGSLARIVRRNHVLRPATPDDVEAQIERVVAADPHWRAKAELRQRLQSVPVPDHLPAFARVLSDPAGHLWVQEYQAPSAESTPPLWTVFDRDGGVLGFVETPAELAIEAIGEDYILGTARDESTNVERVERWPLERSETPLHGIRIRADEIRAWLRSVRETTRKFRSDLTPNQRDIASA